MTEGKGMHGFDVAIALARSAALVCFAVALLAFALALATGGPLGGSGGLLLVAGAFWGLSLGVVAAVAWMVLALARRQLRRPPRARPGNDPGIHAASAPKPVGAYPHARRVGGLLFLSGIGPRRPGTDEVPGNVYDGDGRLLSYDIEAQCRSVFDNVRSVLEDAGARFEDLVDVTVYLTDMQRDFAAYNRVWAEYFTDARPCRTTLGITALPTPIAIELKCIAAPRP